MTMVSISRRRLRNQQPYHRGHQKRREQWIAMGLAMIGLLYVLWTATSSSRWNLGAPLRQKATHPVLNVQAPNSELYNALALDVLQTLDCDKLLNRTQAMEPNMRRRLEQMEADEEPARQDDQVPWGDDTVYDMDPFEYADGRHLFCVAALPPDAPNAWSDDMKCQASQKDLLDLWSSARAELETSILLKTLEASTESTQHVVDQDLHVWSPTRDHGLDYVLEQLKQDADHGGFEGLSNLGPGHLFVDVGSGLGLISMAMSLLYPSTQIVGIEAAAPNWLLQEMNWRCNPQLEHPTLLLAGVGPSHAGLQVAKFTWRPIATTATRSWTPRSEAEDGDIELTVKLRPFSSLLAEAQIADRTIHVLNVDCEGCEYNLIPSMTQDEFEAIGTVLGAVHWGYIPDHKKPSSKRAHETHQRLCSHENYARAAKECCAFLDLPVVSSVQDQVIVQDTSVFPPKSGTVRDVAGGLCDDFASWKEEHSLDDIESDFGWFQLTSMAD